MRDPRYPVSQDESLLPVFRNLHACTQQAERMMTRFLEARGLTPSQFDVLATLGDTDGMSFKELSRRSLVTGGTLTPVLTRLEAKGLVARCKDERDNRQSIVKLTAEGQALYEDSFLPFVDHARAFQDVLSPADQAQLVRSLEKLKAALEAEPE
jgi:DNA-binding MarR family transcriptional regulator